MLVVELDEDEEEQSQYFHPGGEEDDAIEEDYEEGELEEMSDEEFAKQMQYLEEEQANLAEGLPAGIHCPLCGILCSYSTSEDGVTNFWCPNKCQFPWKPPNERPAYFGVLAARLNPALKGPTGSIPKCFCGSECKLIHLPKEKVKHQLLEDRLFFVCAKKVDEGKCVFNKLAEVLDSKKTKLTEMAYANRNQKIMVSETHNLQVGNSAYKRALEEEKQRLEMKRKAGSVTRRVVKKSAKKAIQKK